MSVRRSEPVAPSALSVRSASGTETTGQQIGSVVGVAVSERGLSRRLQFGAARVVAGTAAAFLLLGLGATVTLPPTRRKTSKVRGPRRLLPPPDEVLSEEPAELDNPAGLAATVFSAAGSWSDRYSDFRRYPPCNLGRSLFGH